MLLGVIPDQLTEIKVFLSFRNTLCYGRNGQMQLVGLLILGHLMCPKCVKTFSWRKLCSSSICYESYRPFSETRVEKRCGSFDLRGKRCWFWNQYLFNVFEKSIDNRLSREITCCVWKRVVFFHVHMMLSFGAPFRSARFIVVQNRIIVHLQFKWNHLPTNN